MTAQPTATSTYELSSEELSAWVAFLSCHAKLMHTLDEELEAEHRLSLHDYDVLVQLVQAPGQRLRMCDLANAVLLSRSGLTRLVERLEQAGFCERTRCPKDARGTEAVVTQRGLEKLHEASRTHLRGVKEYFLDRYSTEELAAITEYCERVSAPNPTQC
jgi:DNA-binding MarR family transcriptional regulator